MMTLQEIRRSDVFAAARDFDEAGRFHVWHRRLGVSDPPTTSRCRLSR